MPPVLSLVPELALRPQKTLPLWLAIERFVGLNLNACLTLLSQVELSTLKNKHSRVAEECEQNKHMLDTVQRKLSTANLQVRFPAGGVSCARVWIQVFRLFSSVSKTAKKLLHSFLSGEKQPCVTVALLITLITRNCLLSRKKCRYMMPCIGLNQRRQRAHSCRPKPDLLMLRNGLVGGSRRHNTATPSWGE